MNQTVLYQSHQVQIFREGEGEKILFLHGWPTNSRLWKAQVAALKAAFQPITIDWLGFGISDKPLNHHYSFSSMKEILDTVLDTILEEGEKISLVAHDIGGPPAILWASENEARLKRLILLNTVLYPFKTTLDAISEVILHTPILKDIFVSQFGLRMVLKTNTLSRGKEINKTIEEIISAFKEVEKPVKWKTLLEPLEEGRRQGIFPLNKTFKNIDAEKHLVIAKNDPLCYSHINKLKEENPDLPTHLIPNCGHFIPIDRPDALNDLLLEVMMKEEV